MRNKKQCSYCRKVKYLDDFHNHARTPDGKQTRCKPCNGATRTTYAFTPLIPIEVNGEIIDHRECTDCGETLPLDSFHRNGRGGHIPRCKMCYNARIERSKAIRQALTSEK
ncbi:hypothetical protein FC701_32250 [Bacillus mycoides]|uniref:Uncharacterized protein n=1 Tax=Bacillus mycoides TaxID=1405 RepID=A0A4U2ZWM2_BACMY|nr:hypothetical protein EXW55_01030 [Bacillus mycoides]TKI79278.1 hypothetical protein FC701_32250 [Bacillus mycoides]